MNKFSGANKLLLFSLIVSTAFIKTMEEGGGAAAGSGYDEAALAAMTPEEFRKFAREENLRIQARIAKKEREEAERRRQIAAEIAESQKRMAAQWEADAQTILTAYKAFDPQEKVEYERYIKQAAEESLEGPWVKGRLLYFLQTVKEGKLPKQSDIQIADACFLRGASLPRR